MQKLVCNVRLESWVEPILKDMWTLYWSGFIRRDTLEQIVDLLVRDGIELGPVSIVEE